MILEDINKKYLTDYVVFVFSSKKQSDLKQRKGSFKSTEITARIKIT